MDAGTVATFVAAIKEIPASFWGTVSGAVIALVGVIASNWGNTRRLERQLVNDRAVKKAEREFNAKRDIYLETAEAIAIGLRSLSHYADLSLPHKELLKDYSEKSAVLAKVQVIGSPKTMTALIEFNKGLSNAILKLTELRAPLVREHRALQIEEQSVTNAQQDFDSALSAYKQFNFSASGNQQERLRLEQNTDITLKRVNELRTAHAQKSDALSVKAMGLFQESIKLHAQINTLLPALVHAVREELELPISTAFMAGLHEQASAQIIEIGQQFDLMMQRMVTKP